MNPIEPFKEIGSCECLRSDQHLRAKERLQQRTQEEAANTDKGKRGRSRSRAKRGPARPPFLVTTVSN